MTEAVPVFGSWFPVQGLPPETRRHREKQGPKKETTSLWAVLPKSVLALEIMPEQVHVLVEVDPQFGVHRLVKNLNGVWSHTLRQEFRTPATAGVALKAPSFSCGV